MQPLKLAYYVSFDHLALLAVQNQKKNSWNFIENNLEDKYVWQLTEHEESLYFD